MNSLLTRLFGELTLSGSGGFTGRFLDLCRALGVVLRDVRHEDGVLKARISPNDLYLVRHAARESGMKVRVLSRRGLVFSLHRIRYRYGFLLGAVLFVLIQFSLSGFVWQIDLQYDGTRYTEDELLSALQKQGVFLGTKREAVDADYTENVLLTELTGLKRVAVSLRDTHIFVQAADREEDAPPPEKEPDPPVDLAAKTDAFIVSVAVSAGEELVKPGDTVCKGEALVSGICEDEGGHTRLLVAKGEVIGQTEHKTTLILSRKDEQPTPTGKETKKIRLFFYGLGIKFYAEGGNRYTKCDIIDETYPLTVLGCPLPVGVSVRTEREQTVPDRLLTDEELTEKVTAAVKAYEAEALEGCVIVRRTVSPRFENDDCIVSLCYVCEENIAVPAKREFG